MTEMYDTSRAGAVMLKIAVAVSVDPMAIRFKATLKDTTNHTALTGVCVFSVTWARYLWKKKESAGLWKKERKCSRYLEKGKASSRANAYAILVSANMAEQPVKNWTRITKNHITVPPVRPPALRKICAAGIPVGLLRMASRSLMQKHIDTVSIHPKTPETRTAVRMATGPRMAAS
jgi:hypothetical protein